MRTSTCADSNASATVAYTEPWLAEPAAVARLCPAADRDTPDDNVRSSASSIAATIGGAVHPVIPAKQTLTMGRLYAATIARAAAQGTASGVTTRDKVAASLPLRTWVELALGDS